MDDRNHGNYYVGYPGAKGQRTWRDLPAVDPAELKDPKGYLASPGLRAAVNVALELGMPLLLTGEPGCGKSRLAESIAWELGFPDEKPLFHAVKSDTESRDLFYRFDTLGRFHAAHGNQADVDAKHFVTFNALGKAILHAKGRANIPPGLMTESALAFMPEERRRSVVLVDEIDKAAREVPNDILTEIEELSFTVPELFHDVEIKLEGPEEQACRPVIVITSNSERELPEPFLRRCVYYHVELPPFVADIPPNAAEVTVEAIVHARLGARFDDQDVLLQDALSLFRYLRRAGLQRAPSIAELLNWLQYLTRRGGVPGAPLREHPEFRTSVLPVLLKHRDDQIRGSKAIDDWLAEPRNT